VTAVDTNPRIDLFGGCVLTPSEPMKRAPYRRLSAVHTVHNGYPRTRRRRQPGIGPWNCWATLAQCWARHDNAQHLDRQLSSTRLCPTYPCPGQPIVSKEVIIREPWGCAPTSTR